MAALPGCHPTWEITPLYAPSTLVSHLTLVNSTTNTHKTYNYQCKSSPLNQYCGQVGYEPGLNGELGAWNLVWTNVGECSGVASTGRPTNAPTKARWSGVGCPKVFDEDEVYAEGEKVKGEDGYVYECKPFPYSGYCGQAGFEPGKVGSAWTEAWTLLGSCSGTIEPTSSPNYDLAAFGGCPNEFDAAVTYEAGDKVAYNGIAFQCKEYPYSAWCSHDSYAPLSTLGKEAWEVLGTCEGTMRPTSSPVFDELVDVDGCPDDFVEGTQYEAGDRVTLPLDGDRGVVYKCPDSWPDSGYCNLIPPGHDSKLGWTLEGSCSGTMRPSTSPVFVSLPDTGGCPREYLASTQYEAGDRASLYLDSDRAVVWECKPYPDSPYCNQYPPNHDSGLGWIMIGSCSGTIIPTASPVFQELTEIGDGCPGIYDSGTLYAKEDYASVVVSDDPERVLVYECISAYCNAGSAYKPGGVNSDLGWTLKGYCEGTSQPTSSPAVWTGACTYLNGTTTIQILPWSKSNLATYQGGTRVRKGNRVYQCKPYPYYLWCRMAVYEPEKNIFYSDAWTRTGSC